MRLFKEFIKPQRSSVLDIEKSVGEPEELSSTINKYKTGEEIYEKDDQGRYILKSKTSLCQLYEFLQLFELPPKKAGGKWVEVYFPPVLKNKLESQLNAYIKSQNKTRKFESFLNSFNESSFIELFLETNEEEKDEKMFTARSTMAIPTVDTRELKEEILERWDRRSELATLLIWGPHGVGKSEIVREVAEEVGGVPVIELSVQTVSEIELSGIPLVGKVRNINTGKETDIVRTVTAPPSFLPARNEGESITILGQKFQLIYHEKGGIFFIDELVTAKEGMISALSQMALERRSGGYMFPNNWLIICASNRQIDYKTASREAPLLFSETLHNRLIHVQVLPNYHVWKEDYAKKQRKVSKKEYKDAIQLLEGQNVLDFVIDFLELFESQFHKILVPSYTSSSADEKQITTYSTPRTWANLSKQIEMIVMRKSGIKEQDKIELELRTNLDKYIKEIYSRAKSLLYPYSAELFYMYMKNIKLLNETLLPSANNLKYIWTDYTKFDYDFYKNVKIDDKIKKIAQGQISDDEVSMSQLQRIFIDIILSSMPKQMTIDIYINFMNWLCDFMKVNIGQKNIVLDKSLLRILIESFYVKANSDGNWPRERFLRAVHLQTNYKDPEKRELYSSHDYTDEQKEKLRELSEKIHKNFEEMFAHDEALIKGE